MDGADSFQHSLEEQLRYMDMLPSTELPVVSATVARGDESVQATLEHAKFGASVSKNHTDSYTDSCCAAPVLDSHTGRVLAPHPSSGHGGSTMLDAAGPMNSATGGLGPKDVEDDSSYRMMGDPDSIYGFELDHTMLEQVESDLMHLPRSFHWEEPAAANQNVTAPSSAPVSAPGSWSLFSSCDSDGGSSIGSETGYSSASDDSSVSGSGSCSGSIAGTSRTGRGGRGAKRAGRRSSAPDALVDLGPAATTNFKKENHNRAERERTRKINAYIYELRDITRCGDGDKVSILQTAVDTVKAALSQKQNHQHSVNNPPAISPLCDGMHLAVALVGFDMRFTDCNCSILALLGYSREELLGGRLTVMDCFHPDNHGHIKASFSHLVSSLRLSGATEMEPKLSSTAHYTIHRRDGGYILAACRLSLVIGRRRDLQCFSLLIDGKQEFRA